MTETNPPVKPTGDKSRRNNLNFLRLFLATLVIFSHAPELVDGNRGREVLTRVFHTLSFGELAVDGFFVLSGYLIVQSWLHSAGVADYLRKRVLRIYPGFVVAYLVSVLVVGPLGAVSAPLYFARLNLFQFFTHLVMLNPPFTPATFHGVAYPVVNGALWTIVYEFGCYLIVMALGLAGLLRKPAAIALLFVIALGAQLYLAHFAKSVIFPNYLVGSVPYWPRFLTFFLAGSCFYLFRDRIAYRPQVACLAAALLFVALFKTVTANIMLPTCGAYLLLYAGLRPIEPLSRVGTKADLSYGLYLYAWPVQTLLVWYYRDINPWLMFLAALVLSAGLAWLSWHLVEKPALALKRRLPASGA